MNQKKRESSKENFGLKYKKSPLVNSVPWYITGAPEWTPPNQAVLHPFSWLTSDLPTRGGEVMVAVL